MEATHVNSQIVAIHATPQLIKDIFSKSYFIPDYQRPYSWEKEQCEKLWEDLQNFSENFERSDEKYFLGNIVIYEKNEKSFVVDGQQRLITLTLLMKAIFQSVLTYDTLERCLFVFDAENGKSTGEIKISSEVISEEKESLRKIIKDGDLSEKNSLYAENYKILKALVDEWVGKIETDELKKFINLLLNNVVLLPIHCNNEDYALKIFETINNRGLSLSDTDIFKSKLYSRTSDKNGFIKKWNEIIIDSGRGDDIFRVYMHIIRAKTGITQKEIGLRSFFDDSRLKNCEEVMSDIERIKNAIEYNHGDLSKWIHILELYPNQYWQYPIYTFLYKEIGEDSLLPVEKNGEYEILLKETIRYCYIKFLVHNSVNVIKDSVYKVCKEVWSGRDYSNEYEADLKKEPEELIEQRLNAGTPVRLIKGLCFLSAYLNGGQKYVAMGEIEHILPKQWNHYDDWDKKTHEEDVDKLGNLVVLEKKLNISAQNKFFSRKKEKYEVSSIIEANKLCDIDEWNRKSLEHRNKCVISGLKEFFNGKN